MGTSGAPETTPARYRFGDSINRNSVASEPNECPCATRGNPARSASASAVSRSASRRGVGQRTEVAALARTQAVTVLVDRPQVDARGVECESVAVVEAGVLTVAVQEDDARPAASAAGQCR